MPRLKIYTVPELKDSFVTREIGRLARLGSHAQGSYYVAAHTKADAVARLREIGIPLKTPSKLRVAAEIHGRREPSEDFDALLAKAGDFITGGRHVVFVPAGAATPRLAGVFVDHADDVAAREVVYRRRQIFVPTPTETEGTA